MLAVAQVCQRWCWVVRHHLAVIYTAIITKEFGADKLPIPQPNTVASNSVGSSNSAGASAGHDTADNQGSGDLASGAAPAAEAHEEVSSTSQHAAGAPAPTGSPNVEGAGNDAIAPTETRAEAAPHAAAMGGQAQAAIDWRGTYA